MATRKKQSEDLRNIGKAYLINGNVTFALKELLKAEKIYADDPILQDYLGQAYRGKDRLDLAIEHFKRAIELDHSYAPAHNDLGAAYLAREEWDAAISVFSELQDNLLYTTPHFTNINLGRAYYGKGDYVKSQQYYQAAIRHYEDGFAKDNNYIKALRGLGLTYLAQNMLVEAEQVMEEALTYAPNFAHLHFEMAKFYTQTRKFHKAQNSYQRVIDLAPTSSMARAAKIELERLTQKRAQ